MVFPVPGTGVAEGSHRRQRLLFHRFTLGINHLEQPREQQGFNAIPSRVVGLTLHKPHSKSTTVLPYSTLKGELIPQVARGKSPRSCCPAEGSCLQLPSVVAVVKVGLTEQFGVLGGAGQPGETVDSGMRDFASGVTE